MLIKTFFIVLISGLWLATGVIWAHEKAPKQATPLYGKYARMPRMLSMPDGGVLLSWIEPTQHGHVLKFAVQKNGVWKKQGVVAQGNQWFVNWADFHSVVAIDDAFWVAHWLVKRPGGKTYDYDVELAISHNAGETWRAIGRPYQDTTPAEHGFVTIFSNAGQAGIVWLDGRKSAKQPLNAEDNEQSGRFELRYARIERDGAISGEQVLDANTCSCCWTAVATTATGAVAVWRGRTNSEIRDHRVATLNNQRWGQPAPLGDEQWEISGCPVNGPALASINQQVVSAWFTAQEDAPRIRLAFSHNAGEHFATPINIDDVTPIGRVSVVWQNPTSAYVAWMSAPHNHGKKSWLMLRKVTPNGRLGSPIKVVELATGRDTGVPQMVATHQGLLLAWTHAAPHYGIHLTSMTWAELDAKSKVSNWSDITFPHFSLGSWFESVPVSYSVCQSKH